jgi:carbon-monoxide dehydrogenase large subunit
VRLLTGAGRYVDDIKVENEARALVFRSPVAHGRITGLDVAAARAAPGVLAVYTADDVKDRLKPFGNGFPLEQADKAPMPKIFTPHLAADVVRFVGQPVAFIVAETLDQARDASELIELDVEDLPVVTTPATAMAPGAPVLHAEAPGNVAYRWRVGDADATAKAFDEAAHVVRTRVANQRLVVNSVEPRASKAQYDPATERWTVHAGTQGSHALRDNMAGQMGVEKDRIRVVTPDVGGGFGMKLQAYAEDALVAISAKDLGRPVAWIGERSESFVSDVHGRDVSAEIEGAFDADGRLRAIRCRSTSNLGAYISKVGAAVHTVFSAPITGGVYEVPNIDVEVQGVFTNVTPMDAYRGAGRPEVSHMTERLMEAAARQLNMDRAAIRRLNLVKPDQLPYPTAGGFLIDSLDGEAIMDRALAAADYANFPARRAEAEARGKLLGIGVAYYMERTGGGPVENASLRLLPGGSIEAAVGTQSTGQGHDTAWSQVIHEKLGVPLDSIRMLDGDTDLLPAGGGTGGSRSAIMASRVFIKAADDVIEKAMEGASQKLEASRADIEYSAEDGGRFRIKGTDRSVTLFEAVEPLGEVLGLGDVDGRESTFPNGCHIAEVEIDPETGLSTLTRYSIADDFGTLINPEIVKGQVEGGVVQGIGQALVEQALYDPESGQPLTGSFMDYQMPRAADIPQFDVSLIEVPSTTNPLGIKGCGEAGAAGGLGASTLAVLDALRGAGVENLDSPYTPFRVWSALRQARS